jgi:hypothetical protein
LAAYVRQIWRDGLPSTIKQFGSETPSTSNHFHVYRCAAKSFALVAGLTWDPERVSTFYAQNRSHVYYSNESNIAGAVNAALFDLIEGSEQLRDQPISLLTEFSIPTLRPDIVVLKLGNVPVGFCEVKKPSVGDDRSPLEKDSVLSQACSYALQLRQSFGVAWAFVLLTTFSQWRVVWLDDEAGNYAAGLSAVGAAAAERSPPPGSHPPSFCMSEVVESYGNAEVAKLVVSVLLKMVHSPILSSPACDRLWPLLEERGMSWSRMGADVDVDGAVARMPPNPLPPFYRVRPLGAGRDGSSWLVWKEGFKYVLKFIRPYDGDRSKADREMRASTEASRWRLIWGVEQAQAVLVMGREAFVMPFVRMFGSEAELREHAGLARRAVEQFAAKGWVHNDLRHDGRVKWEHFGRLVDADGSSRVVLIDLAEISPAASPAEALRGMGVDELFPPRPALA